MADITRTATAVWDGPLLTGSGTFTVNSGAIPQQAVSWAARTEEPNGKTSPEELLAAAHASCFASSANCAWSTPGTLPRTVRALLATRNPPPSFGANVTTEVTVSCSGGVLARPSVAEKAIAKQGEAGCPVSNALRGNVDITVEAILEA